MTSAPDEIRAGWDHVIHGTGGAAWHATIRDLAFLALALWLLTLLWRAEGGLRSPWVAYSVVVLAVPLSSGTITSMARFSLMAFPLMWPLADWLGEDTRRVRWAVARGRPGHGAPGAPAADALSLTRSVTVTGS